MHPYVIYNSQVLETAYVPASKWVDQKTVVLILHSRKPTFCDSLDGTGEYFAKWNKPVGERQIPYDLTYKRTLMNKVN